jgi:large subunit ribosomal protein L16
MLLFPTKTKYKKYHKNSSKLKKKEISINQPSVGFSGLKIIRSHRITASHIETIKKVIVRVVKRKFKSKVKLILKFFPDLPITKKSSGIRMGKGKGNVEYWCFLAKAGRILLEFDNRLLPLGVIFNAFTLVSSKLPIKSVVIL